MSKITNLDRKILFELDKNSRQPFTLMARNLRTSPQLMRYRVENLVKNRIIQELMLIVDYKKIGYTNYLIYLKLQNLDLQKENEFIEYLKNLSNVNIILRCEGGFDLAIGILARDAFQLNEIFMDIQNKYGQYIRETGSVTHIGSYHFKRSYLINEKILTRTIPITGAKTEQISIDDDESNILSLLSKNTRLSIVEIANKLKLTIRMVSYKIRKLEKEKIILNYNYILNHQNLGIRYYRILIKLRNSNKEKENQIFSYCNLNPRVFRAIKTFGNWEMLIDVEIEGDEFRNFLQELRNNFNDIIQHYETLNVYKVDKFVYYPVK